MDPLSDSVKAPGAANPAAPSSPNGSSEDATRREPEPSIGLPFSRHVDQRTVVLPELRVLFLPVPKAGCTTLLWLLAELACLPLERFAQSTLPEVSPALTVHDMSLWGDEQRLAHYEDEGRTRVFGEDGWFRFSVVRHPGTRLWSAWYSKLLLREPRFVDEFRGEPWFPRVPERPADLLEDFRRFVAALPSGQVEDVHWAVQHDLIRQLPLAHVGKVEQLDDTLDLLRAHVGEDRWPGELRHENRSALPMATHLAYDDAAAAVLHQRYADDFEQFGYEPVLVSPDSAALSDWEQRITPILPLLRDAIERNARVGQLHQAARVSTVGQRRAAATARQLGRSTSPVLANLEGYSEYKVRWAWGDGKLEPGFTAVVRVKNEARSLPWVLPPLFEAVRRVVLIDNGSTDGTSDVASKVAEEVDASDRLELLSYPFRVSRCGDDHLNTPPESVHSLAYFYNWSFSHVHTAYALKWDGDMVLTDLAVEALRDLAWQLEAARVVVKIPRFPLYVADEKHAFLDTGMANCEPWGWPNRPGYKFVKAMEWELPLWPEEVGTITLPNWSSLELKHLDLDEFGHWSHTDFEASERTQRKRREFEVFRLLADGGAPPAGVAALASPDDRHVIDYVRSTWVPENGSGATWSRPDGVLRRPLSRAASAASASKPQANGSSKNAL
jgi:Sulfotransferase family